MRCNNKALHRQASLLSYILCTCTPMDRSHSGVFFDIANCYPIICKECCVFYVRLPIYKGRDLLSQCDKTIYGGVFW